jgi:hypothetical protein
LKYAAALGMRDLSTLTERLYNYGRYPLSPRLRRAFPTPETVRDHLIHDQEPVRRLVASGWRRRRFSGQGENWALWLRSSQDAQGSSGTYKLYVSPVFECLTPAFQALVRVVTESDAVGFKVGADLSYLARPDKLVVYLCSYEETIRVSQLLEPHLVDLQAHGVPFTCPLGESGLLSWAIDPPDNASTQDSWRGWLTHRLAEAMIEAPPDEQVGEALRRAESLGVDPVRWEPRDVVWEADGSH